MKLGMNTHGRSSASDLFMTIAGSSVVVRWIGGLAHLDLTFAMDVMRMIGVVLPITPALAAGSIYNSADPQSPRSLCCCCYRISTTNAQRDTSWKNKSMKLQSKSSPLSPTWDVLVENNKDMKTTPQSKPIQVTKTTQVYRKRGGGEETPKYNNRRELRRK